MAYIMVKCPQCRKDDVIKFGRNAAGSQRYRCKNSDCDKDTFLLEYMRNGDVPDIKQKIIKMAMNGAGIRDTARTLGVSVNTVLSELKKKRKLLQT